MGFSLLQFLLHAQHKNVILLKLCGSPYLLEHAIPNQTEIEIPGDLLDPERDIALQIQDGEISRCIQDQKPQLLKFYQPELNLHSNYPLYSESFLIQEIQGAEICRLEITNSEIPIL